MDFHPVAAGLDGRRPGPRQPTGNLGADHRSPGSPLRKIQPVAVFRQEQQGLSPIHCVSAVRDNTYENFQKLVDEATCWVPKGYRLAARRVDEETGEVLQ